PQYVLAFLAASKLGMVVSSISPLLTPPEITHQANDARIHVLLSFDALYPTVIKPLAGKIPSLKHVLLSSATELLPSGPACSIEDERMGDVSVLALGEELQKADETPVSSAIAPEDVLFLQYTGGTTGKAKGAQLTLRNIFVNNLQADAFNRYRVGEETIASAYPMFHIGGAAVTYNSLRAGATFMVIPDPRNVVHFCAEMKARPPTVLIAVPALFQMLLACPAFRELDFSGLRLAISAAAPFSSDEIQKLEAVIGEKKICELYGMTETSPVQTCNPASRFKLGSVGIPVPGTDIRIVDAETGTKDLPLGEPGEIIVHGPQVMKGYLSADGTSEALRELDGKLWMYTGDIGVMDEEGYLSLCDRSKDMLIVGGYKLFSVEVESKLQALPFVALSAMIGRPDAARPGNDVAHLYVQRTAG
ncbi:MAG: AMP-binding protein, partial [Polyangiaceae bacterium]|nr:AMP-binding protein [Polyangiaceae bacterium]